MRRFLIVVLAVVVVCYFFLVGHGEPVDEGTPIAAAPQTGGVSNTSPSVPDEPVPAAPVSDAKAPLDKDVAKRLKTGSTIAPAAAADEVDAALRLSVNQNKAQLYAVLFEALDPGKAGGAEFRELIMATLEVMGSEAPAEILAALVQSAPTPELRQKALRLIGEASATLSVDSFHQALENPDPAIRRPAETHFEEIGTAKLLDAVATAVSDSDRAVRLRALKTMYRMHEFAPVWEVAETVVDDPDPQIRMLALELLIYGDRRRAIDRLALALSDPDPEIRELAEELLDDLDAGPP